MLKEYLFDIASSGSITHTRNLVNRFLEEWKTVLVEVGFTMDAKGIIQNGPKDISGHIKGIEEYIVLRCLLTALDKKDFNQGRQNCCESEWEHYHLPEDMIEKCQEILKTISGKFGNSTKTT